MLTEVGVTTQGEIERGVLAGLMWHPDRLWRIDVEPEYFASGKHRAIFQALAKLAARGETERADWTVVQSEVEALGEQVTLSDLAAIDDDAGGVDVVARSKLLREAWQKRTVELSVRSLQLKLSTPGAEVGEVVSEHIGLLQAAMQGGTETHSQNYRDAMLARAIEICARPAGTSRDVMTGFHQLDRLTGGLPRPGTTIVGGRPSRGKSVLMRQIAEQVARQGHGIVLFCTPEQATPEVMDRALAAACSVELRDLRRRNFDAEAEERLLHVGARIADFRNLYAFDEPNMTTRSIQRYARRMAMTGELVLIVVDYLQFLRDRQRANEKRHEVVGRMGRDLKELGKELNCAVVLGCQLGRDAERKEKPTLEDLRESGDLEQDADVVLLIGGVHDPEVEDMRVLVAKQRQGSIGAFDLRFERKFVRVSDPSEPDLVEPPTAQGALAYKD